MAIKCTLEDLKRGFDPQVAVAMSDLHSAARHLRKVPKQEASEPPREAPVVVAGHIPVPHVQGFADYLGWRRTIEERRAAGQAFPWTQGFPKKAAWLFNTFMFCCTRRENDATTREWRATVPRDPEPWRWLQIPKFIGCFARANSQRRYRGLMV